MGLFSKKEERIGEQLASELPSGLSPREINKMLSKTAEVARQDGYSSDQADEIAGATFRSYLKNEGRDGEYPEIYEQPKGVWGKLFG